MSACSNENTRQTPMITYEEDLRRTFFVPSASNKLTRATVDYLDSKIAVNRFVNLVVEHNLCHGRELNTLNQFAFFKKIKITEKVPSEDRAEGVLTTKIKKIRVELLITEWNRLLPEEIANDKTGENFVEPITGDTFSPQEALSAKFVCIGRYIFLVSSVVRRILTDSRNYIEGIYHPIENRPLSEEETVELRNQLGAILTPKLSYILFLKPPIRFENDYLLPTDILTSRIKVALKFREKLSERLLMTLGIGGWIEKIPFLPFQVTFLPFTFEGYGLTVQSVLNFNRYYCLYIGRITAENNQLDPRYTEDNIKGFYARELNEDYQITYRPPDQQQT